MSKFEQWLTLRLQEFTTHVGLTLVTYALHQYSTLGVFDLKDGLIATAFILLNEQTNGGVT